MPSEKLKNFLDENDIKYLLIQHSLAFTAVDIAKSVHMHSRDMAKTVIVKVAGEFAMVVVPANYKVDLNGLQEALKTDDITLATEVEFFKLFPDCEVGAMPPFGNLYDMDVYVAESLTEDEYIAFNAGTHSEVIQMDYRDYEMLVKPKMVILLN